MRPRPPRHRSRPCRTWRATAASLSVGSWLGPAASWEAARMSKKPRGRKPAVRRIRVDAPGPARTSASALRPELRRVIELARDLPQLADPMDAEMLTGRALTEAALSVSSTPMHAPLPPGMTVTLPGPLPDPPTAPDPSALTFDGSTEHALWGGVIDHAAATPSRRSLALLRAMAVLVPDAPTAAQAAAQADALAASDVPEPPLDASHSRPRARRMLDRRRPGSFGLRHRSLRPPVRRSTARDRGVHRSHDGRSSQERVRHSQTRRAAGAVLLGTRSASGSAPAGR